MLLRETTVIELSDGVVGFENVGVGDIDVDIGVNVDVVAGAVLFVDVLDVDVVVNDIVVCAFY